MMPRTNIGAYGEWAVGLHLRGPGRMSFLHPEAPALPVWRRRALARVWACMAPPPLEAPLHVRVRRRERFEGLDVEALTWRLPWGPPTEAVLLKPAGARGPLPGVLGLHCHGGNKVLGRHKIVRLETHPPALVARHQATYYGGKGWACELARRGYVVLVHDGFAFGSRRVRYADTSPALVPAQAREPALDDPAACRAYNAWAADHESVMAKALFSAGTTWPGVCVQEDRAALDVLCARPEVDARRVGCGGLSGGGLRTTLLAGLDPRIAAAFCVGFSPRWRDLVRDVAYTHTWMTYVPHLPRELDFPEILGLRCPRPTLVLNTRQDALFTLAGMRAAHRQLKDVYAKAGAPEAYVSRFFDGPHRFNLPMQALAFDWLDRQLQAPRGRNGN